MFCVKRYQELFTVLENRAAWRRPCAGGVASASACAPGPRPWRCRVRLAGSLGPQYPAARLLIKDRFERGGVAQWIEGGPTDRGLSAIASQATCQGCGLDTQEGACKRQPIGVSISPFLSKQSIKTLKKKKKKYFHLLPVGNLF